MHALADQDLYTTGGFGITSAFVHGANFFFPFTHLFCVWISGGVHHSYHALRGPFCFADPRHNSARVHGRHQGLPPHRLQAAQQSRG